MKTVLPLLLLALSCTSAVCAQTVVKKSAYSSFANRINAKPQLELTTSSIVEQHSCSTYESGFTLRFTFRNTGNAAVILNKRILIAATMGYLWFSPLTSLPMPFTVELNRPIKKCQ